MRSAQIIFSQYAVDCTILNLTNRGASLELAGSFVMPDSFEITLDNGRTLRNCRVIWRRNERLGVAFEHHRLIVASMVPTQTASAQEHSPDPARERIG